MPQLPRTWHTAAAVAVTLLLLAPPAWSNETELLPGHQHQLQRNDHALGLSGGYGGSNGFAYRKYIGDSYIQANLLPLYADRGDFLAVMLGAGFGHYLLVWNQNRSASLLPSTTALKVTTLVATWFSRDETTSFEAAPCAGVNCEDTKTTTRSEVENLTTVAAGVGFEFGAVQRHGFSLSIDVMMTAAWDEVGFLQIVPLPYAALMYSW